MAAALLKWLGIDGIANDPFSEIYSRTLTKCTLYTQNIFLMLTYFYYKKNITSNVTHWVT